MFIILFYTFSSLWFYIQAILLESPTRQLTLGDIYKWFTTNFKYFRTTSNLTWKVKFTNLISHFCYRVRYCKKESLWQFFALLISLFFHQKVSPLCSRTLYYFRLAHDKYVESLFQVMVAYFFTWKLTQSWKNFFDLFWK